MDEFIGCKDPRGPLGHRGNPKPVIRSIDEFIELAVENIKIAYRNAYAEPQERGHAIYDMECVLDDLKEDYRSLVYNIAMGYVKA